MKIIKTANGKKTLKISKSEWFSLGKQAGWLTKKAQMSDMEANNAIVDNIHKHFEGNMKPVYVSVYEVSRAYGGPEEGGWWYDNYGLKSTKKFFDREEAEQFANKLRDYVNEHGLNDEPLGSSKGMDQYPDPSNGDPMYDHSDNDIPLGYSGGTTNYSVIIEDNPGESVTTSRPHYE